MFVPFALTPLSASGAALNTFQTTKAETTPPLHGTLPHGEGTVAVTQLTPDPTRPYSDDPSGKSAPSELLVVGRARGEQRADGTYHGHITIAQVAGLELLAIDTNPGESKTGPLDSVTSALCSSTGGEVCLGVLTANSTTTATGSTNHFAVANLQLGGLPGVTLPPGVLSALGATAASSDGNITSDGTCQTATGSTLITKANLGPTILADVIKSTTVSKACNNAAPTETDSSTVIPTTGAVTGLLNAIPSAGCASGGNPNPDGSAGGTANTVAGLAGVLDLVCNAADQSPAAPTNSSDGGKQATSPYGVREGLDAFVLALGGGTSLVKLTTAASDSTATAPPAAATPMACPAPQVGTEPNCTTPTKTSTGSKHVCNSGGDNDCVTGSGPYGPSIPEGGATDTARDCREHVENVTNCPTGATGTGNNGNGATTVSSKSLPFTGFDPLPVAIVGLLLLGTGLTLRRFSGMID